jgi:hypothetical protein
MSRVFWDTNLFIYLLIHSFTSEGQVTREQMLALIERRTRPNWSRRWSSFRRFSVRAEFQWTHVQVRRRTASGTNGEYPWPPCQNPSTAFWRGLVGQS